MAIAHPNASINANSLRLKSSIEMPLFIPLAFVGGTHGNTHGYYWIHHGQATYLQPFSPNTQNGSYEPIFEIGCVHPVLDCLRLSADAMYIMFTVWGCFFFGSMKDPFYDGEEYREDGGDGSGNWIYEKQMDIEESSRAALLREEMIEEIEQKVGSLKELEEAGNKEKEQELVK